MSFHDVRFPTDLSIGSGGGPERRTEIVTLSNGFEERNSPWAHSKRRYDAGLGVRSLDDLSDTIEFFEARHGQLFGFRWKDWSDFKSCKPSKTPGFSDQVIGVGDGLLADFKLSKTYAHGPTKYVRPISKPVLGTVIIAVAGDALVEQEDYSVDYLTGLVTFMSPPVHDASITSGFEFDVPVRFDTDRISTSLTSFAAGEIPNIPVIEVRV